MTTTILLIASQLAAFVAIFSLIRMRRTRQRYLQLLEHLPQTSVTVFDHELRFLIVVGPALSQSGVDPTQVIGKKLGEVVPGEQGDILARHYKAALRGESRSLEYSSTRDERDYWLRIVPVKDGEKITGGMAVSQDITDRKQAERERAFAEGSRQMMIESMNEAYVAMDQNGVITDWNATAEEIFGWSKREAIGRSAKELFVPEEDFGEFDRLLAVYARGKRRGEELALRAERGAVDRSGRRFTVELTAETLEHGGEVYLHTFMHDITDRKRQELELAQHAADVEALSEATGALARSTSAADARAAICKVATQVSRSEVSVLFEPDSSGRGLVATAAVGAEVASELLPFTGPPAGAVRTFTSREPLFVRDVENSDQVASSMVRQTRTKTALWVPVIQHRDAVGVIAVGWREQVDELPEGLQRIMTLVAAEAGVAIERASLLDRLGRMARTDDLTGLPNRRAWEEDIVREIARAKRERKPLTVCMADLDHFKAFNDQHGHQAGDRLLKEAAGSWRAVLRETDLLSRYGGEEFAIALPDCSSEQAAELIERLRAVTPSGQTCSAGLAEWNRSEAAERLIGRADEALYEAKRSGRDRTVVSS